MRNDSPHQNSELQLEKSYVVTTIFCLCILGIAAVFLGVVSHTMFNTDDCGWLIEYQPGSGLLGVLQASARLTGEAYMQHMGAYTSYFLGNVLIFSIVEGGFSLSAAMGGNLLLIAVLLLFVVIVVRSAGLYRSRDKRNVALPFVVASLFCVYDTDMWPEIDSWISGGNAYGIATIFGLLAASMMYRRASDSKPWLLSDALCAFLGEGGTQQITGGICCILLVILLVKALLGICQNTGRDHFRAFFLGSAHHCCSSRQLCTLQQR